MQVLAFSGWKMSGKDMCADYLVERHGFTRISFADALKEMIAEEYNIPLDYFYNREFKEAPLLQYPVEKSDKFTRIIHGLLLPELRDKNGNKSKYIYTKEQLYWTPRALAIFKGSGNRAVSLRYWTDRVINQINKKDDKYVIADLRFISEINLLKEAFEDRIKTIRISRFNKNPSTDVSETNLDDYPFDFHISNSQQFNRTKQDVFNQLENIIKEVS